MTDASDGDFSAYEEVGFQAEFYGQHGVPSSHFLEYDVRPVRCGRYLAMKKEKQEVNYNLQIKEVQVLSTFN